MKDIGQLGTFFIEPAGKHLLTIGEGLIQDRYAAIMELVKNSFDADSPDVRIHFDMHQNKLVIKIIDHGHGMTYSDVTSKWLVPSTSDKVERRVSPLGRIMQGKKGIGRYAASILGNNLLLETVTYSGEKTTALLDWDEFRRATRLSDVPVLVESFVTQEKQGTILTIEGGESEINFWKDEQIRKLRIELRKIISPDMLTESQMNFHIFLEANKLLGHAQYDGEASPFPIASFFDYRISGSVSKNGCVSLTFENRTLQNSLPETISYPLSSPSGCGNVEVDIRVYDRENEAIDRLIQRGMFDEKTGDYLGRLEAKRLLNSSNGIGVFRNGFRIRPLGDADFDWLKLNEKRVQNPSVKVGSNQVIGYVRIESEELSFLEEKSARDGLKENDAYERLKWITLDIISQLETRRFLSRRKLRSMGESGKTQRDFEKLFDYSFLKSSIEKELKTASISPDAISSISHIIDEDQKKKSILLENLRNSVAFYQGQATLGKIVNVILHEGAKPLSFFVNQIPIYNQFGQKFLASPSSEIIHQIINKNGEFKTNMEIFVEIFQRLDPLAARKRQEQKEFSLKSVVASSFAVFENEFTMKRIRYDISKVEDIPIFGWVQDIYTIMTNLIDNSIYWISNAKANLREIKVKTISQPDSWVLDYSDSGPGIEPQLIRSGIIFEPEFSTKPDGGMGLGLAISGEAAQRNNLQLSAIESSNGAHFQLFPSILSQGENEDE